MIIRQARLEDLEQVKNIIDALQVSRGQFGWEKAKNGLFEYSKSIEELQEALNLWFNVAETEKGIRGFCLAYNSSFFTTVYSNTDRKEFRYILDNFKDDFLYVDQLASSSPDSLGGARIVTRLADKAVSDARNSGLSKIVSFVSEFPMSNERSKKFLEKQGCRKLDEVSIENGVILAAYVLDLAVNNF